MYIELDVSEFIPEEKKKRAAELSCIPTNPRPKYFRGGRPIKYYVTNEKPFFFFFLRYPHLRLRYKARLEGG